MRRILTVALLLTACAVLISLVYNEIPLLDRTNVSQETSTRSIELAGQTIRVMVADTPETRERGLSGREGLAQGEGMLFIFSKDGRYAFWMKDMRFAIDILWISREGLIVDIRKDVSPTTYPAAFEPRMEARYVVELPAGWAEEYRVEIGDVVRL